MQASEIIADYVSEQLAEYALAGEEGAAFARERLPEHTLFWDGWNHAVKAVGALLEPIAVELVGEAVAQLVARQQAEIEELQAGLVRAKAWEINQRLRLQL